MPDLWMDVDAALAEVPVNIMPLLDDTDYKTREVAIAYNAAGMDLVWNFVTTAGAFTQTAVTPTTAGNYDWVHQGDGMYTIEITASGGASINNDTEGFGWFTGFVTGVLPWRGPTIGFRAAALNNSLIDGTTIDVNVTAMAAGTVTAAAIATGAIDADAIADNAIDAGAIAANAITSAKIATDAIGAAQIAADAIGSSELAATAITEIQAGLSTVTTAQVNTEVAAALAAVNLDHLVGTAASIPAIVAGTYIDQMMDDGTATYDRTTDSLQAIRDRGDAAWVTGTTPPTAGAIADAVWDEDATAHQTQGTFGQAIGDPVADADTIWGLVNTNLNATVGSRATQTSVDTIDDFLDTEIAGIITTLGTPAGASISVDIAAIEAQTDDIGVAGAGLTAVPWNAAWDAQVESEVTDALNAYDPPTSAELVSEINSVQADIAALNNLSAAQVNAEVDTALADINLDHLVKIAVDTDFPTTVHLDSVIGQIADNGTTATFDRTADSLEALQGQVETIDNFLDAEVAAILADTNELQTDWADGGRLDLILDARASQTSVNTIDDFLDTEIAGIITTLGTPAGASVSADIAAIEAQTDDIGAAGAGLTAVPWNSTWDTEVQSEVDDALVARGLDHLLNAAVVGADITDNSIIAKLASKSATADWDSFDNTTDSLEALADGGSLTVQQIVDGVWDETLADHLDSGSTGEALNSAGGAGDPWITALPGAYGSGTAGNIIGNNLNATVSSRSTQASVDTIDDLLDTEVAAILADTNELQSDWTDGGRLDLILDSIDSDAAAILADTGTDGVVVAASSKTGYTLSAAGVQAIWDALTSALTTAGSVGKLLVDNINATISSRSSHSAADVWAVATRLLTAGTNIVLAKGIGVTGFNDLSAAQVNAEADTALADYDGPTHAELVSEINTVQADIAALNDLSAADVANAVWDEPLAGHLGAGSTGAALNAAGGSGDPWSTALPGAYGAGTAGKIIGDNLNATVSSRASQSSLDTLDDYVDTEVAAIKAKTDNLPVDPADASDITASFASLASTLSTIAAYIDTEVAAIKAKTDNLPASPAATGDIPTTTQIKTAIFAGLMEGRSFEEITKDIWAQVVGGAVADDASAPTEIVYEGPDSTTQITHTITPTTRTVS